ncbi:MAG: CDP-diacylglycerol--glycerol-3-phosphate 3-phosphatidyltransferase [Verrucomicrobiae bacterium]|nr:CDP-diacylglycerol--glycerol-3-phosphate 3-phosphatidyltransferase [Verrucomicrobiae bacterium]
MTLADKLTVSRVPLAACFIVSFFDHPFPRLLPNLQNPTGHSTFALGCFLAACLTDTLDGWVARRRGETSVFGALWDPIADKILVSAAWVAFVAKDIMPAWVAVALLARDFAVSGLRMVAAQQGVPLSAERGGKLKTILHLITIGAISARFALVDEWGVSLDVALCQQIEFWFLFPVCLAASLGSGWVYFRNSWKLMQSGRYAPPRH